MTRATWQRLKGELDRMERELRTTIPAGDPEGPRAGRPARERRVPFRETQAGKREQAGRARSSSVSPSARFVDDAEFKRRRRRARQRGRARERRAGRRALLDPRRGRASPRHARRLVSGARRSLADGTRDRRRGRARAKPAIGVVIASSRSSGACRRSRARQTDAYRSRERQFSTFERAVTRRGPPRRAPTSQAIARIVRVKLNGNG